MAASFASLTPAEESWLNTQLAAAAELAAIHCPDGANVPLSPAVLDRVWAAWVASAPTEPAVINAGINAVGIAFGSYLVQNSGFSWVIASDEWGTDLAVLALPGTADVLVYPANFVAKREKRVLALNELSDFDTVNPAIYEWHRASKSESYNGGSCGTTVCMDRKLMPTPPFINAGHDHFRISLKNGWGKSSVKLVETDSGADFNLMGTTTGPKPILTDESAGTEVKATVKWGVLGPLGWIRYRLEMEIEGPRGVPFK